MTSPRRLAIAAGTLFLVADAAGVLSVLLSQGVLGSPELLGQFGGHGTELGLGALLEFVMGAAGAGIAIALYPVLRPYNAALAIGAVAFRTAEAVAWMLGAAMLIAVVTLGQDPARTADPGWYQNAAALLLDLRDRVALVGLLAFSLGAAAYYWVFFQARILPWWLSGWGLLGTALWIAGVAWGFVAHGVDGGVLVAPLALNELALAAWLIVRGFATPVTTRSGAAAPAPHPATA